MLLIDLFELQYKPLRLRGRSPNTSRLYRCTISSFRKWLRYEPTLADFTDITLARFLEHRASYRSPYTAEKERTQLLCLWRFAADRRLIDTRPEVPAAPLPDRIPEAWTVEQLRSLVAAARATRGNVGDVPAGIWFTSLILTLWETAERVGAVLACLPADFDSPNLRVRAAYRKGRRRERIYRLSEATSRLVEQARGKDALFSWPMYRGYLWDRYRDVVARAGLGRGRKLAFHQLRRSAATHYAALGGDATKLLDHSSPRLTERWYLDSRMLNTGPQACDVLPAIGSPVSIESLPSQTPAALPPPRSEAG